MLKGKALAITISAVTAFVALVVAVIGVTFSWYSTHVAQETGFTLPANGIMVVYFDEDVANPTGSLKPALAIKDEITENVVAWGDVCDEDNPLLVEPATVVTGTAGFEYLNSVPEDTNIGKVPATVTLQVSPIVTASSGATKTLSLTRDVHVSATITVTYHDGVTAQSVFSTGAIGSAGVCFEVAGDATIGISYSLHLRQVDDLVDPAILSAARFTLHFAVLVEPQEGEAEEPQEPEAE